MVRKSAWISELMSRLGGKKAAFATSMLEPVSSHG